MKFTRVLNKIDEDLVVAAENKLSQVFLELGLRYDNITAGTHIGGDPLIFSLVFPLEHVCTLNIPTAATDGKRYYWHPKFVIKKSRMGLRLLCTHEAGHALYMHPSRRGSRNPKLWNVAVDYIVNDMAMEDLKARKLNAADVFSKEMGKYMTLKQLAEMIKNPLQPIAGFEGLWNGLQDPHVKLPKISEDRELSAEEAQKIEDLAKRPKFFYADDNLDENMKRPEAIYDYLYQLLPKCPKCGSLGYYKLPDNKSKKKNKKEDKNSSKDKSEEQEKNGNDPSEGNDPGENNCPDCSGEGGCPVCGKGGHGIDLLGLGGTMDEHIDTEESQEKLAKRIAEAMEAAKKMAGSVPSALEDELGKLTAPVVSWQDMVRTKLTKARNGNGRNDYTRFRTRPMFAGLMVPKRRSYFVRANVLLDTSGSMSSDDMAFGLSQLCALDERGELTITFADAQIYWDQSVKIRKCKMEEIQNNVKPVGRGGTVFGNYFEEYRDHLGECDMIIVITDGSLMPDDITRMKDPGIDVMWLITSETAFQPPFGRVFALRG
jgi:predicted metal-dependent peptidase